jgi:uncharacterized cysteine cluster protein YcgN (CxxCxxCC family)
MTDLAFKSIQLQGKLRRFFQASILREDTEPLIAKRQGECNRCGECCKIVFRCPFLGEDKPGEYTCRIYEHRFAQCQRFPLRARDLREVKACSYTFPDADLPSAAPAAR